MFDSPIDRHRRTKKSLLPFWLLIATILIVFGYCLYATVGPNPPIIVSKATTHLTAPLGKDGLPDYAAVLLADAMKGVTPETNAAVPLVEALVYEGTDWDTLSEEDYKLLCDTIGAAWPADLSRRIPSFYAEELRLDAVRLLKERMPRAEEDDRVPADADSGQEFGDLPSDFLLHSTPVEVAATGPAGRFYQDYILVRPWSRENLPFLADWFEGNQEAIDNLVLGLDRPAWGLPAPGGVRGERELNSWIESAISGAQRQAARVLLARSLHRIGQEDWLGARHDGLAILKLSVHLANEPFLVDQLVAIAIDGMGLSAIRQLALSPGVPAVELRKLIKELDGIGPASRLGATMDRGERYFGLGEVIACSATPDLHERLSISLELSNLMGTDSPSTLNLSVLNHFSIDWNVVLRRLNSTYDQVVTAAKIVDSRDRRTALLAIDAEVAAADARAQDAASSLRRVWTSAARGELAADVFVSISLMQFGSIFAIEDRNRIDRELTRIAIALSIHYAEQGEYPGSLNDLMPVVLPAAPVDPVYGGPLAYRRTDDGFLIYSLGFNGVDDGGSNDGESVGFGRQVFEGIIIDELSDPTEAADLTAKIHKGADDLSFRAPLPIKPWPWEKPPGDGSPAGSVESSSGD
jgi:hypothetical protein